MGKSNFLKVHINGYKEGTTTTTVSVDGVPQSANFRVGQTNESSWATSTIINLKIPFFCTYKSSTQSTTAQDFLCTSGANSSSRFAKILRFYSGSNVVTETVTILISYAGY